MESREEHDLREVRGERLPMSEARCPYRLRADIGEPPRFMQKLPIDKRGYCVPWFVDWVNGEPEFRAMDLRKFRKAITNRLCWTCGNPLFAEAVFVIGPMCAVNRISSEPPSHRECAEYAARYCPFLSKPHMTRRDDDEFHKNKLPAPGVMVERNPGVTLLWYTRRYTFMNVKGRAGAGDGVLFQLVGRPFKLEWYSRGRLASREEIRDGFESGLPLLMEAAIKNDGPDGVEYLKQKIEDARKLIPR
jgi:hypothetical protein